MPVIATPPAADRHGPTTSPMSVPSPVDTPLRRQFKNRCSDRYIPSPRNELAPVLPRRRSHAAGRRALAPSEPTRQAAARPYLALDRSCREYGHEALSGSTVSVVFAEMARPVNKSRNE